MIAVRQSRAACALLGWTQETLAEPGTLLTALKRLESENGSEVTVTMRSSS